MTLNHLSSSTRTRAAESAVRGSSRMDEIVQSDKDQFQAIFEAMPDCVMLIATDGTLLHINYAGLTLVEAPSCDAVESKSVYSLIVPEDRDRYRKFHEKVCAGEICAGERCSLEFDIIGIQGARRRVETRAVPFQNDDGSLAQLAVIRDITERRRALEESLRLSAIVASSDDAIISKDLNGIITSWNSAAERIFGYTAEEVIGRPINTIIPPDLHDDEVRILQTIGRGERIEHFETVRITKGGEKIEVSLTVSPLEDESGRIVGAAKIARDITQRKKSEHALHTAQRLASVGRLAATVAHEINNPLEALTNLIYLARNAASADEIRTYLAGAEEELERVSHLTKQTLGFYRETKGVTEIHVGEMVTSLLSVFSSRMRNKGIEIDHEITGDPKIHAVPGEIRQLLANLLSNAIDAVGSGGRIRVRLSASTEWTEERRRTGVRFTVADNGSGISEEVRAQLFEPFFTTKKDVGTGLGLWVCKSIVQKHHGTISVKSSANGGKTWTAFSVFLPANGQ